MNKFLFVGDPHVTIKNLNESSNLFDFIAETARDRGIDNIVLLGDLFHTHGVIRLEVLKFYIDFFKENKYLGFFVLAGNHDMILGNSPNAGTSAIELFDDLDNVFAITKPTELFDMLFVPYMSDNNKFINVVNSHNGIVVCHQTFNGAQLENGFYAPGGVDPKLLKNNAPIISGHIHKHQSFENIIYLGTPKWDTLSDANEEKGIYALDIESNNIKNMEFISTEEVVTKIVRHKITEINDEEIEINEDHITYLDIEGSSIWVKKTKDKYKGKAIIRAIIKDKKKRKQSSSKLQNLLDFFADNCKIVEKKHRDKIKEILNG